MNETLPQQEIRRRLMALLELSKSRPRGRGVRGTDDLRIVDVARYIGRDPVAVNRMARGADINAQDQLRLSRVLVAHAKGELVKTVSAGGQTMLNWQKVEPTVQLRDPRTLRIEITPDGPRFKRTPIA